MRYANFFNKKQQKYPRFVKNNKKNEKKAIKSCNYNKNSVYLRPKKVKNYLA